MEKHNIIARQKKNITSLLDPKIKAMKSRLEQLGIVSDISDAALDYPVNYSAYILATFRVSI
jgi:hypothetical protein